MRHKYNKRKEAFNKSKRPPKRRMKEERDKDVFKRRKFIKNVYEEEPKEEEAADGDSSSGEEEAQSGLGQLMKVFGGNIMDNHAIESDSEEENEANNVNKRQSDDEDVKEDGDC